MVTFDDGSTRVLTSDARVSYASPDACGEVDNSSDSISVASGAKNAGCTSVTILATITLGTFSFTVSSSRPLAFLEYIDLDFTGYPSQNSGVSLSTLNAIQCMPGAYHHASARVRAYLTDSPTTSYTVTAQSSFSSSDASVVSVSGSRMRGVGPGTATITSTFGLSPSSDTAILSVSDSQVCGVRKRRQCRYIYI